MYGLQDAIDGLAPVHGLNYPTGYLTSADINTQQYLFYLPGYFDPLIAEMSEAMKQPVTPGELLTLGSIPSANSFGGPVLVITGSESYPFYGSCGYTTYAIAQVAIYHTVEEIALQLATLSSLLSSAACQRISPRFRGAISQPTSNQIQDMASTFITMPAVPTK